MPRPMLNNMARLFCKEVCEMSLLRQSVCAIVCSVVLNQGFIPTARAEQPLPQEMISLPVQVINDQGTPVSGVKIIPWALRSSQGHGHWSEENLGKLPEFVTDDEGEATVTYPRYTYPDEFVRTTEVTLSVDHPDYVYISHEDIAVPLKEDGAFTIFITPGGTIEITPFENGVPAPTTGLHAVWSDERWYKADLDPLKKSDGAMHLPPMAAGSGQVFLVRIENERATHFSRIDDVDIRAGETSQLDLVIRPAAELRGTLSADVPRPIKQGRIVARTLSKDTSFNHVTWSAWTTIDADGNFVIENWPADEAIQIIALTDDHIAKSGAAPAVVAKPPREPDFFNRPQVFQPDAFNEPLVVEMEPMVECVVEAVNENDEPLAGVTVGSNPNVGWWNDGSQIYCGRLHSSEKFIVERDSSFGLDSSLPNPFSAITDQQGIARLFLPTGKEDLYVQHDEYELPIIQGRRRVQVELATSEPTSARLVLQPKGKEFLGEWDKLAGVLFGCTGEECRRLLDNPEFRERITAVRLQLDEAEDEKDPELLKNIFAEISAAFDEVGDQEEVARWRQKAEEQAAKLKKQE